VEIQADLWDEPVFFFIIRLLDIHKDISQLYLDWKADIHRVHFGDNSLLAIIMVLRIVFRMV